MNNIQTFSSYNRDEIIDFLAPYEVISLREQDNNQFYQVNFWLPPSWFIILCLLFPIGMLLVLPVPRNIKILGVASCIIIIPVFLFVFNKLFRAPLKSKMIRLVYDKDSGIFKVPYLQLEIAHSNIIEFVVISGWHKGDRNNAGNMSISELSIVFKEDEKIKRIPLFLSVSKNKAIKIAERLSEYTGKEYYQKRVTRNST